MSSILDMCCLDKVIFPSIEVFGVIGASLVTMGWCKSIEARGVLEKY